MSYIPPQPFLDKDNYQGGTFQNETDPCVKVCPAPMVQFGFSLRTRVYNSSTGTSDPFGDWTPYDVGPVGVWLGGLYIAVNTDPDSGGIERQIRAQILVHGNGRAGVIRYRQIITVDTGIPVQTALSYGTLQTINLPQGYDEEGSFDFVLVPCAIGETSFMAGGPGGGGIDLNFFSERQSAFLRKKGFRQYTTDETSPDTEVAIYRKESVISGGSPGCVATGIDPRDYSGAQEFQPVAATPENEYIEDPAGLYADTLSTDLEDDHHATTPYLTPSVTVDFGKVTFPVPTVKKMVEKFKCGAASLEKSLELELSNLYLTGDLLSAVETALGAQLSNDRNVSGPDTRVVHRQWLCPENVHYERVRTTLFSGNPGTFDTILGGPGEILILNSTVHLVKRSLSGGAQTESTIATSSKVQADDTFLVANGRGSVEPDDPIPPLISPWDDSGNDGYEILVTKVTCKPNQLLCVLVPTVEDPAVLDLGYD